MDITHTSTVSDDEEEEPIPVNSALLSGIPTSMPLPDAPPNSGSLGTANAGTWGHDHLKPVTRALAVSENNGEARKRSRRHQHALS